VLEKCAWLENPQSRAMSISEMEFSRNIVFACSTRSLVKHWCGEHPIADRNVRKKWLLL
jgi:hypothetical protein